MVNYEPSDVLISPKEPYNKNTIWIYPTQDNIEIRIFDRGWKLLFQTKDLGLSNEAKNQVKEINKEFQDFIIRVIKKYFGKFSSNNNILYDKQKALEDRVKKLEDKIDKMNKKYSKVI